MKQSQDSFNKASTLIALTVIFSSIAYAWTGPTDIPPNGNVAAPINAGGLFQEKTGPLRVQALRTLLDGYFDGRVGIGIVTPTEKLDVVGNVKVSGTSTLGGLKLSTGAGAGKVLTSDATGNTSWKSVPTGTTITTTNCSIGQAVTGVSSNGTVTCGATTISNYSNLPSGSIAGSCVSSTYTGLKNIKEPVYLNGPNCACRTGWNLFSIVDTGMGFPTTYSFCIKN